MVSPSAPPTPVSFQRIALAGNPNAGKTTLFNALTGLRQKVGNYPGVTVDRKEGRCRLGGHDVTIIDLPGTYSLDAKSPDEEIARDILLGIMPGIASPDCAVVVVDASNLERNLVLATQIMELGLPTVIALNMTDVAAAAGRPVDADVLSRELGCPVVEIVALRGAGISELKNVLAGRIPLPQPPQITLPEDILRARDEIAATLADRRNAQNGSSHLNPHGVALRLLGGHIGHAVVESHFGSATGALLEKHANLAAAKSSQESSARYGVVGAVASRAVSGHGIPLGKNFTDRVDSVLTHRVLGLGFFALITYFVFQAISRFAELPMGWIEGGTTWLSSLAEKSLAEGPLRDLLVNGVIAGVGGVLMFLPQILILFFFIGVLEDSGYMARAAFIMDRIMAKVGLHGRAFIPLLSSFACAIPGIMATRTIASRRDRMVTILIAPLMSCSARLPVYFLMIGTFFPDTTLVRVFSVPVMGTRAFLLLSLYLLGIVAALLAAVIFKRFLFPGAAPPLMIELPTYKIPAWRNVVSTMWARGSEFLYRAGTVIFSLSIILWFLLSYPKVPEQMYPPQATDEEKTALAMEYSIGGSAGRLVEPLIAPLGFNWKIGIGLVGAMAAREVFVSTLGTVYATADADEESVPLREAMKQDRWPDGRPVWTKLTAISLLVYFVISMQCISTLGVVKRETDSYFWPFFMLVYMTALAWFLSFVVYQGGHLLGFQ